MKQLGSSCLCVPLLRLFFSLPFGCLAVANSFVWDRGSDFSLDFGPAERDVDTSARVVTSGPARWGETDQHASSWSLGQHPKLGFS